MVDLQLQGFDLNPYDLCLVNKVVGGKQMAIVWHVNGLKMSHKDEKEVTQMIKWMKGMYGYDMRILQWKKHDYLVMYLDYSMPGEVRVNMDNYLKKVILDFPKEIKVTSPTPAPDHFFDVRSGDECKILDEERAAAFHHGVAQLIFGVPWARKDI